MQYAAMSQAVREDLPKHETQVMSVVRHLGPCSGLLTSSLPSLIRQPSDRESFCHLTATTKNCTWKTAAQRPEKENFGMNTLAVHL